MEIARAVKNNQKKKITSFVINKKTISLHSQWRDGRVVECGGLENRCSASYRGFESLSLRNKP